MGAKTSKAALARQLGISRAAMYYRAKQPGKDAALREQILQVLDRRPSYGHRRIAWELGLNKKRVLRVMNQHPVIRPTVARRHTYPKVSQTVVSETPNYLKNFCPIQPDVAWVGDFTELWFHGRKVFFATVLDSYTREVIGWQLGLHHTSALVVDVLKEARRKRDRAPQYFHSDQGSEYTSHACVSWLVRHRITPSNSPKGKPWHNGRQEAFYGQFKLEFQKPSRYHSVEQLVEAIGRHIHDYNTARIHSALRMPPRKFYEKKKYTKKEDHLSAPEPGSGV